MVLLVLPCLALPATAARAGGVGDEALRLTVTVNGRGQTGLRPPALRAGGPVVKRYRIVNRGEAHLYGVKVVDPQVPSGSLRCPTGPLAALGELECVARFRAAPGAHRGTVRAEGAVPSLGRRLTATARTGYTGVAAGLTLTERVTFGAPGRGGGAPGRAAPAAAGRGAATLTYTVTNRGNRPLHAVRVEDTALGLRAGAVDCAGRPGTVPLLAPGASARCTATVRRAPGTHRSTGLASGSDRVTTYGPGGGRVGAPTLVARSSAVFTVTPPVVPAGAGGGGGGVRNPALEPVGGRGGAAGDGGTVGGGGGVPGAAGVAAGAAGAAGVAAGAAGAAVLPEGVAGSGAGADPLPGAAPPPGAAAAPAAGVPGLMPQGPPLDPPDPPRGDVGVGGVGGAVTPPSTPSARRAAALDSEGFLGRVRRRGREASELGVATTLLLLLIPAAVAAALLGNRRS
ncbi:DUF7507 domain-containing protein [Streptomyces exfoliatus]|uniref:DUF7507 domain-containing protein n=1 Tax=Streptomyces exfoliatus TaxID=1905 RepID=UPI0037A3DD1A